MINYITVSDYYDVTSTAFISGLLLGILTALFIRGKN